jgi:hypothetical protein
MKNTEKELIQYPYQLISSMLTISVTGSQSLHVDRCNAGLKKD